MKPAVPAVSGRTPYAERPEVIFSWCQCLLDIRVDPKTQAHMATILAVKPECPLHGDHATPTPF